MSSAAVPLALAGPWQEEIISLVTGGRQTRAAVVTLPCLRFLVTLSKAVYFIMIF